MGRRPRPDLASTAPGPARVPGQRCPPTGGRSCKRGSTWCWVTRSGGRVGRRQEGQPLATAGRSGAASPGPVPSHAPWPSTANPRPMDDSGAAVESPLRLLLYVLGEAGGSSWRWGVPSVPRPAHPGNVSARTNTVSSDPSCPREVGVCIEPWQRRFPIRRPQPRPGSSSEVRQ